MNQAVVSRPVARSERLLVENVGDEAVIFDLETRASHALKPLAAAVYTYADGLNSVAEIAELASYRLATPVTEAEVAEVVAVLGELELVKAQASVSGLSRRDALKTFAAVGAGAALITTVSASAAAAATTGQTAWGNYQFCAVGSSRSSPPDNVTQTVTVGSNGAANAKTDNVLIPGVGTWSDGTAVSVPSTGAYDIMPQPGVVAIKIGSTTTTLTGNAADPWETSSYSGQSYEHTTVAYGGTCSYLAAKLASGKYTYSVATGSWQCVPCDGGDQYQCCSVVCAPASYGYNWGSPESSGTPASPNAQYTGCGYDTITGSQADTCSDVGVPDYETR